MVLASIKRGGGLEHLKDTDRIVKGISFDIKGNAFGFDKHLEGIPFENLKETDRIEK